MSRAIRHLFFCNDTATPEIYTLSLHDALPICRRRWWSARQTRRRTWRAARRHWRGEARRLATRARNSSPAKNSALVSQGAEDRKSTRLNSSHQIISYAVFCLKKKKNKKKRNNR